MHLAGEIHTAHSYLIKILYPDANTAVKLHTALNMYNASTLAYSHTQLIIHIESEQWRKNYRVDSCTHTHVHTLYLLPHALSQGIDFLTVVLPLFLAARNSSFFLL